MSGDVQPRKRKEKRRKKDDLPPAEPEIISTPTKPPNDDVNIHVHHEGGTGGGMCAKVIFFILLAILAVLIGLILVEYRGTTEVDTQKQESRFAQMFDGWVDETPHLHDDEPEIFDDHEDHSEEGHEEEESHEHEEDDEEEGHDEEESHEHEDDVEGDEEGHANHEGSEEEDGDIAHSEEEPIEETNEISEEQASVENDGNNEDDDDDNEVSDENNEEEENVSEQNEVDDVFGQGEEDDVSAQDTEENVSAQDVEDVSAQDVEDVSAQDAEDNDFSLQNDDENDSMPKEEEETDGSEQHEHDDNSNEFENDVGGSVEAISIENLHHVSNSIEDDGPLDELSDDDGNQLDDSEEKVVDNDADEAEILVAQKKSEEEAEVETSSMAVKFGVGVALVVVAHVVLIRKWSDASTTKAQPTQEEIVIEAQRRNTIVPPINTSEQLKHEINTTEQDDDQDYDEEDGSEEEIEVNSPFATGDNYNELCNIYKRNLEPEFEQTHNMNLFSTQNVIDTKVESDIDYGEGDEDIEEEEEKEEDEEKDDEEKDDEEKDEEDEEEDEEGRDDEDDEDVYDEELLKKLEVKYGKLVTKDKETEEEKQSDNEDDREEERFSSWRKIKVLPDDGAEESDSDKEKDEVPKTRQQPAKGGNDVDDSSYKFAEDTNDDDWNIADTLDAAQAYFEHNVEMALAEFSKIVQQHSTSPRALYGRALALDHMADVRHSNKLLQEAILGYKLVLNNGKNVPDSLYLKTAERCIDRMRFKGDYLSAVDVHKQLIAKFPNEPSYRNQLAVTYLMINRLPLAKHVLHETLLQWPYNGFAQVHYGFVLKTGENDMDRGARYLHAGIKSGEPGTQDGRFFFHLGDAYMRMGRTAEAYQVYDDGVKQGLFLSRYQRSLYNVNRLTGRPWWTSEQTGYINFFSFLEKNWRVIRNEGLALLNSVGLFKDEAENLKEIGDWKQFELFARGRKLEKNCKRAPLTCKWIENFPIASQCHRGQVKFSVMHPNTHVWAHCGPTNCRLRAHLGLKIPNGTSIRVAEDTKTWEEGKIIIFDDSFEHEVWHNGTEIRLVLIVDVWHPELTAKEKAMLPAI